MSLTECPVTAITADSDDFREAYLRQRILADCGVAGLSPSQLPIRLAEAFIVIRQCENEISNARDAHAKLTQTPG